MIWILVFPSIKCNLVPGRIGRRCNDGWKVFFTIVSLLACASRLLPQLQLLSLKKNSLPSHLFCHAFSYLGRYNWGYLELVSFLLLEKIRLTCMRGSRTNTVTFRLSSIVETSCWLLKLLMCDLKKKGADIIGSSHKLFDTKWTEVILQLNKGNALASGLVLVSGWVWCCLDGLESG